MPVDMPSNDIDLVTACGQGRHQNCVKAAIMGKNLTLSMTLAMLLVAGVATVAAQQIPIVPRGVAGTPPSMPASADILRLYDGALDEVVEKVLPAVVRIEVTSFSRPEGSKYGRDTDVISRQRVLGSGVIVDPDGYIMTNAHVVLGAERIRVTIAPTLLEIIAGAPRLLRQQRVYDAKLVGSDRLVDLALLKIEEKGLSFIALPEGYSVRLGQIVLAIGSPEGLDHTVTRGIVSAVERQVDLDKPMVHVQTDAPINPGSSGGALIDRDGNLIGLNTFRITEGSISEGLGFAIPEPVVRASYLEFKEHGHLRRPTIKAHAQAITPDLAAGLKLPRDSGVVISDVVLGGPADKAGIEPEDVIAKVDNQEVDSLPRFSAALLVSERDRPIEVEVLRGREVKKLSIMAVEDTKGTDSMADLVEPQNSLIVPLGVFVLELTDKISEGLPGLRSVKGLIVAAKVDYTPKLDADLEVGDIIRAINRIPLNRPEDLRSEIARYQPGDAIVLEVERKRVFQFTALEME
jgi:serine protease Do